MRSDIRTFPAGAPDVIRPETQNFRAFPDAIRPETQNSRAFPDVIRPEAQNSRAFPDLIRDPWPTETLTEIPDRVREGGVSPC
ncbi:MAG: hypothetical protein H6844_03930 [Alphaproteobacteria bacterium]|nr:hypothetical protein [Alphaproteobacteria bacterium]